MCKNGNVFEKGGVNISAVHGELPKTMQQHFGVSGCYFDGLGRHFHDIVAFWQHFAVSLMISGVIFMTSSHFDRILISWAVIFMTSSAFVRILISWAVIFMTSSHFETAFACF